MIETGTLAFHEFHVGGGVSVLAPVYDFLPLVVSVGAYEHHERSFAAEPGAFVSVFWGARSFNYGGAYNLAGGLVIEGRRGFGDEKETALLAAIQVDIAVLALPFEIAVNALR